MERFLAFSIGRMQFLDSFQFASESLEKLAASLTDDDLILMRKEFPDEEQFELMRKKGVFPYDMLTDIDVITNNEVIDFPPKEKFFNKLKDEAVKDKDWEHGKKVFEKYCTGRTFGEYHDIYLRVDVLLLADFFEKYRKMCMANYGLEPLHYFTAPRMAWDSALKMTDVVLELITAEDQYLFLEVCIIEVSYLVNDDEDSG